MTCPRSSCGGTPGTARGSPPSRVGRDRRSSRNAHDCGSGLDSEILSEQTGGGWGFGAACCTGNALAKSKKQRLGSWGDRLACSFFVLALSDRLVKNKTGILSFPYFHSSEDAMDFPTLVQRVMLPPSENDSFLAPLRERCQRSAAPASPRPEPSS